MEFNEKLKYYMTLYNISSRNINSSGNNIQVIGLYILSRNLFTKKKLCFTVQLLLRDSTK